MIGKKVLVTDSDIESLQSINLVFKEAGAQVITAQDSIEVISKAFAYKPDLIILDMMVLGRDGFQLYKEIKQYTDIPVIIVTALNQEHDKLQSLEASMDDFLIKPLQPELLLVHAKAVVQSSKQRVASQPAFNYDDSNLKVDIQKHRVLIRNRRVKLTPIEFRLLVYLVSNADKVLSFEQILASVWGSVQEGHNRYVHIHISHLRRKIEEDTKKPRYIQSIHGVGYIFEKQAITLP